MNDRKLKLLLDVRRLALIFASGVLACGLLFCIPGVIETNCEPTNIGLCDAVYFSVVTVTTVGYGDFHPIGLGKFIVIVETLFGLVMTGLIVNAFWERQTTKLVHEGDQQFLTGAIWILESRISVHFTAIYELLCGEEAADECPEQFDFPFSNLQFALGGPPKNGAAHHGGTRFDFFFSTRESLIQECRTILQLPLRSWDDFSQLRDSLLGYYTIATRWSNVRLIIEKTQSDDEWSKVVSAWIRKQEAPPTPVGDRNLAENYQQFSAIAQFHTDLKEQMVALKLVEEHASKAI